ncbi:DMT family transporter [Puniceibacterium confluentis]|uniref:DMT family transporter n=2 Tax=Puniceibacterium confluentis TaxID=1958944 RepID=UPI0011B4AEED|nr:DMT family transporter [Puniceibacterium confluentis]
MQERAALAGVTIMALVALGGALDSVIVRLLAGEIHPFVVGFTRVSFGLLAMLPLILRRPQMLRTKARFGHVLRAALKLGSLVAMFAALQAAPIATVTAIGFAAPLFVTLGAWAFFTERPGALRLAGLGLGFVGVVTILGPAMGVGQGGALMLALLAAALTATIQLMLKLMGRSDSADTLVAWNLILSVPLAAIPAWWFWTQPTAAQWGLLALQGFVGTFSQLGVTRAFQLADASLIAPVDFLRLPLVALAGWLVFAEIPRVETWVGALLIFVAIIVMTASARRSRVLPIG